VYLASYNLTGGTFAVLSTLRKIFLNDQAGTIRPAGLAPDVRPRAASRPAGERRPAAGRACRLHLRVRPMAPPAVEIYPARGPVSPGRVYSQSVFFDLPMRKAPPTTMT
jgi:hypothetical protein